MNASEGFVFGMIVGLSMGLLMTPMLYLLLWQPLGKFWRGWRLRIQTTDDVEKAVNRELDKRWRDLEGQRRLRLINLEVEERMRSERAGHAPATQKRP